MLVCDSGYVPEKYKDYKNRTVTKNLDKLTIQLQNIKSNYLKLDDKKNLILKMQQLITEF